MSVIEQDIPIPAPRQGRRDQRGVMTTLRQLEVGQSYLVKDVKPDTARGYASVLGRRIGRKFATRQQDEGIRVWRTA